MYIHEKFQNGWVIAIGFLKFGVTAAVVSVVGGISIT